MGRVLRRPLTPPLTARWGWQRYHDPPLDCKQGRQGGRAEQAEEPRSQKLLFSQNVMRSYSFAAKASFGCRAMVPVAWRRRGFVHPGVQERWGEGQSYPGCQHSVRLSDKLLMFRSG